MTIFCPTRYTVILLNNAVGVTNKGKIVRIIKAEAVAI